MIFLYSAYIFNIFILVTVFSNIVQKGENSIKWVSYKKKQEKKKYGTLENDFMIIDLKQ